MATVRESTDEPRSDRLGELVHIEGKIAEAAEAAAEAAAHAVEATKAAEAAGKARANRAKNTKSAAKNAEARAAKAAMIADASGEATELSAPPPKPTRGKSGHILELRLTADEWERVERQAADQGLAVPDLARTLLVRSLARPDETD